MITIVSHSTPEAFLGAMGSYLEERETENNLVLGIARTLTGNQSAYGSEHPRFWSLLREGHPIGGALMTPPRRIILTRIDANVDAATILLRDHLAGEAVTVPGVVGPSTESTAFAHAWLAPRQGLSLELHMRMRVFEIREVLDVPLSPGHLREATTDDLDRVLRWALAFSEDVGEPEERGAVARNVERAISNDLLYVWEDGEPVSLAKYRPTERGATISMIYTPPEKRCRGYATTCVASLTRQLLAGGYSFCNLFTDLANPTSNSIYAKIGYRPLGDSLAYDFVLPRAEAES